MYSLEKCIRKWPTIAPLIALSVGTPFAANRGTAVLKGTSSNVGIRNKYSIIRINYNAKRSVARISKNNAKTYSLPNGFSYSKKDRLRVSVFCSIRIQ
ncbi:MAG: hypothetical protein A4E44_01296 [Methanosaeta sp. PtaB.Bin018]|nr:MAG: hypothetical protein A4E44_01296 [Methanosaeta sp. PtaB.Bin018]OPY47029.1 MAG: hypothetical protein A4E46_00685 [Methanosaeta sp. PtaU1.Bin016]